MTSTASGSSSSGEQQAQGAQLLPSASHGVPCPSPPMGASSTSPAGEQQLRPASNRVLPAAPPAPSHGAQKNPRAEPPSSALPAPATSSTSTQPPLPCSCRGRAPSIADRTPSPASSHGALHSVPSPLFSPLVAQELLGPTSARSMSMAPSSSPLPVHGRQPLLLFTKPSSSSLPWWTLGVRAPFPLLVCCCAVRR
jgi:hypothetical protein